MSNYARKFKRSHRKEPHCCGRKMTRKMYYDTDDSEFYVCEKCGKEKWVKKK